MIKSDKIREYFRAHPEAQVTKVAAKFKASKPMVYKLRKEVLDSMCEDPEMVSMPEPGTRRKVLVSSKAMALAAKLGLSVKEYIEEGIKGGHFNYEDEEWQPPEILPVPDVDKTLDARAQDYGTFKEGAALMQGIKRLLADHARRHDKLFADDQWEAIEMIVHKMARIVNGNPDKVDSWIDIAGYATLVSDRLQGNAR